MMNLINNFQLQTDGVFGQLRYVEPQDQEALVDLYRSTRQDLLTLPLPPAVIENLIVQQWEFQQIGIKQYYPKAISLVLEFKQSVIGQVVFVQAENDLRLIDIAILPSEQGKGIARALLQQLQNQAACDQNSFSLQVFKQNTRARRLYLSLGMQIVSEDQLSEQMQWHA